MARSTVAETTPNDQSAAPAPAMPAAQKAKRGRGRPPIDREAQEEAIEASEAIHEAAAGADGDQGWFEQLTNYSEADWQNMIMYLFRTAPTIDRRFDGRDVNIRKYGHKVDLERIMLDEGSGAYRIDLLKSDPVRGSSHRISRHYFRILNMDHPPRVPLGDWIEDPANAVWKWAKPKLEAAAQQAATQTIVMPNPQNPMDTIDGFLSGVEKLNAATGKRGGEEGGAVAALAGMIAEQNKLIFSMLQQPKGSNDLVIEMLKDELKATREEIRSMRQTPAPPAKTLAEQITEVMPVIKMIKGTGPAASVSEEAGWLAVADKVADHIPDIVGLFKAGEKPGHPGNATDGTVANPAAKLQPQPPDQNLTEEQRTAMATVATQMNAVWNKYGTLFRQVAPFMMDMFMRNVPGYALRDWFIESHGMLNWKGLKTEASPEILTALTQAHPQLKTVMTPPETVEAFFVEFLTDPGIEEGQAQQPVEA